MQIWRYTKSTQAPVQLTGQSIKLSVLALAMSLLLSCAQLNLGLPGSHDGVLPVADNHHMPQAIKDLLEQADQQFLQREYNASLATLERALRIKPRYPEVWSRMAQVYLYQGKFPQTRQHAERSNSFIKNNADLKYFNDKLIQTAREGIQP